MDISALPLPLRKDRPSTSLFSVSPSITSVNVSYETAAGNLNYDDTKPSERATREPAAGPRRPAEPPLAQPQKSRTQLLAPPPARPQPQPQLKPPSPPEKQSKPPAVSPAQQQAESPAQQQAQQPEQQQPEQQPDQQAEQPPQEQQPLRPPEHAQHSQHSQQPSPALSSTLTADEADEDDEDSPASPAPELRITARRTSQPQTQASPSSSASPTGSTHEFPVKIQSPRREKLGSDDSLRSTFARSPVRPQRARSSFSVASAECQSFVNSLKEPKYAKPLTADEIAWIFQDFYLKLRAEILGPADELLTREEQELRKQTESELDLVLDKAERAVTGGELYAKLFALGGNHDALLQPRISAIREHPELLVALASRLDIAETGASEDDLAPAVHYLNRLSKETSPKAKLVVLAKAHHSIVEALPKHAGDADTILPLFVLALTKSSATDWWQNFMFIQRFRRASELVGQAAYCLTNLEAAIHVLEQFTADTVPDGVDPAVLAKPIVNPRAPRQRSSSQSSKGSSSNSATATASFSQRLGDTLSSYRSMFVASRRPPQHAPQPLVDPRFLHADADALTLGDVKTLLREYKRLAEYVEANKATTFNA